MQTQQTLSLYLNHIGTVLENLKRNDRVNSTRLTETLTTYTDATGLLSSLDNTENKKKCFTLAKQADEETEQLRLSSIRLETAGGGIRVELPRDKQGMFYYDVSELDPNYISAGEFELQFSKTRDFKSIDKTIQIQTYDYKFSSYH